MRAAHSRRAARAAAGTSAQAQQQPAYAPDSDSVRAALCIATLAASSHAGEGAA
jgi:hypothetical protein